MNIDQSENQDFKFIISNLYQRPKWFFKFTQENSYNKYAWLFLYLAVLGGRLGSISSGKIDIETWTELFFKVIILGAGLGLIGYIIFGYILSGIARWFKGVASAGDILRVISYSSIPGIPMLLFYIIGSFIFGISFFSESFWLNDNNLGETIFKTFLMMVSGILGINISVFMVLGIATVSNFSIWKAILTMILPIVIFVSIIALLGGYLF